MCNLLQMDRQKRTQALVDKTRNDGLLRTMKHAFHSISISVGIDTMIGVIVGSPPAEPQGAGRFSGHW